MIIRTELKCGCQIIIGIIRDKKFICWNFSRFHHEKILVVKEGTRQCPDHSIFYSKTYTAFKIFVYRLNLIIHEKLSKVNLKLRSLPVKPILIRAKSR